MSAHSREATICPGCNQRILFPEFHVKHCVNQLVKEIRNKRKVVISK